MTTRRTKPGPDSGVIATIRVVEAEVILVFHDVSRATESQDWKSIRLFTEKPFSRALFVDRDLRREDYEDIGFNVVNRLCALAGLDPSPAPTPAPDARNSRARKRSG